MQLFCFWILVLLLARPAFAVERVFNFSEYPLDQPPPGFRSVVAGTGKPGDWKVILDESPAPETPASKASVTKRVVLAQLARNPVANHFPILIFDQDTYGDFTLTTRFKIVGGAAEQIAGLVFRYQSETNYFVATANALRGNLVCYQIAKGEIAPLHGLKTPVASGEWHTLGVRCEGNRVDFTFDDQEPMKLLVDGPATGQIGFWTKSDTVCHFVDTKITYTRREVLAQALVRENVEEFPRLLGLKIFAVRVAGQTASVVASKDETEIGRPAGKTEEEVLRQGLSYYGKDKGSVSVTAPLRDRNGDAIAAVRVELKSFPGQTEDNAVARAMPIVKKMQLRVQSLEELLQ